LFLLENLGALVLWLLLMVVWVNVLFLCFVAFRRLSRKRYFEAKDGARERFGRVIDGVAEGEMTPDTASGVLRNIGEPERDAVHELVFDRLLPVDAEKATDLLFLIGSVERWSRQAFGRKRAQAILMRAVRHEAAVLPAEKPPAPSGVREKLRAFERSVIRRVIGSRMHAVERAKAVKALGRLSPPVALVFAAEALNDPSRDVRRLAMTSLGVNAHPDAIALIVHELERTITGPNDVSVRAAKAALTGYGMEHLHYFVPWLRHRNGRLRFLVIDAIRDISARAASQAMLNKNDFPIELYQVCLENLTHDPVADVRARTAGVVRQFRDPAAVEALRGLMKDENEFVRMHAVRASSDRHLPILMKDIAARLGDERWRVREAAVKGLTLFDKSGERELFEFFISATDLYACEQLAEEIQRVGLVQELMQTLASDSDESQLAFAVLRKLVLLEKDASLLQVIVSQESDELVRLRVLDVLMVDPRPEVMAAVQFLAQTDAGLVGDRASSLLETADTVRIKAAEAGSSNA